MTVLVCGSLCCLSVVYCGCGSLAPHGLITVLSESCVQGDSRGSAAFGPVGVQGGLPHLLIEQETPLFVTMEGGHRFAHLCCAPFLLPILQVVSTAGTPTIPHFTGCLSRDHETFRCWWDTGSFWNLSAPGALRVFYLKENSPGTWHECPEYSVLVPNECYFSTRHTSVWTSYCVQLHDAALDATYDELCFSVDSIVFPEPPVGLNWTLLNASRSGLHYDVLVHWDPPPSADIRTGWISLEYEVRYREKDSARWRTLDMISSTERSIYGLCVGIEYEVQVRCRMVAHNNFGEFSRTLRIFLAQSPSRESSFSMATTLIFTAIGAGILILLLVISQHHRLTVIFLPPVPGPKIKGIDPDLLKGKLDEISSILGRQDHYKVDNTSGDLLVDFIELDLEEPGQNVEDSESKGYSDPNQSDLCCFIQDCHSGRESSCKSELSDHDLSTLESPARPINLSPPAAPSNRLPLCHKHSQPATTPYSHVGKVTSVGELVLSAGQMDPRSIAYTSEICTMQTSADLSQRWCYEPSKGGVSLGGPSLCQLSPSLSPPADSGYTVL
ncbi:growth hormone receptor-like isoform X2 [Scleropages formosus]|uniref:growth hormone receptor-like isoform X2 n=1 Tax=Scleropages formosus TaxID=113540 RepID=UPI000877F7D8|nr:growth hormone receptor-like isoform X2 [Scleropages formosus]